MTVNINIEAIYEDGVLKPSQPLPLKEHQKVRIAVVTESTATQRTYGLVGWTGDSAEFDRILRQSELDYLEQP